MQLAPGDTVGIDGKMFSAEAVEDMRVKLQKHRIRLKSISDPLEQLWADRPPMPEDPAFIHETKYAGKSSTEKISIIREELKSAMPKHYSCRLWTKLHGHLTYAAVMYIAIL